MIEALKDAFNEVAQLPEEEQRYIAEIIRQEIVSEKRWQTLFHDPRSERALAGLVAEALAEDRAGETEEIMGDSYLPCCLD
ncbi:MAG: hypothetical protein JO202_10670 [Ktedonobacteraceae bacterium]|nr:hypothetical protein [Ktedonobacteraceae bacterium]